MEIRFYTDPETGEPHIYDHGVTEREVVEVLSGPTLNQPGRRNSRIVIGRTSAGRCLKVVIVPDGDRQSVFVVTAYELRGKALRAYRRASRRKRR